MHKQDCNRDCGNCNFKKKKVHKKLLTTWTFPKKKKKGKNATLPIFSITGNTFIWIIWHYQDFWNVSRLIDGEKKIWEKCTSHTARLIDCKTPVIDLRFWQTFHFSVSFARVSLENYHLLWEKKCWMNCF